MKIFLWIFALSLIMVFLIPSQEALSQETAEELYEAALFKKGSRRKFRRSCSTLSQDYNRLS